MLKNGGNVAASERLVYLLNFFDISHINIYIYLSLLQIVSVFYPAVLIIAACKHYC